MSTTTAPDSTAEQNAHIFDLVRGLGPVFARQRLDALDRAMAAYRLAVQCEEDCRVLSCQADGIYGEEVLDDLAVEEACDLFDIDGSGLVQDILYAASDVLSNAGSLTAPEGVTPLETLAQRVSVCREGTLGRTARGEDLPAAERLAIVAEEAESFRGVSAMAHAMLDSALLGIKR